MKSYRSQRDSFKQTFKESFSERLKKLLDEKNISLRKAARIANVSPGTLTNWTSNGTPKYFKAVKKLAEALGTSMSFLLIGEDDSRPWGNAQVTEAFLETRQLFDGYAKITITELVPRHETRSKRG